MARICIPDYEYKERVQKAAAILRRENLDVMIVNGKVYGKVTPAKAVEMDGKLF